MLIAAHIRSRFTETLDLGSFQNFLGQYPNELFSLPNLRKSSPSLLSVRETVYVDTFSQNLASSSTT